MTPTSMPLKAEVLSVAQLKVPLAHSSFWAAVHWDKLQAFLNLYCAPLSAAAGQAMQELWRAWNSGGGAGQATSTSSGQAWPDFAAVRGELNEHAQHWARQLAANNLALNLLDFSQKIGRMRALKIEGQ